MLFSSQIFLWFFLPLVLLAYRIAPGLKAKNAVLLVFSLLFYARGEPKYIILMLLSICLNYMFGLGIQRAGENRRNRTALLWMCVGINLCLLGYFKYFNFFLQIGNRLLGGEVLAYRDIALPIGISFYKIKRKRTCGILRFIFPSFHSLLQALLLNTMISKSSWRKEKPICPAFAMGLNGFAMAWGKK